MQYNAGKRDMVLSGAKKQVRTDLEQVYPKCILKSILKSCGELHL